MIQNLQTHFSMSIPEHLKWVIDEYNDDNNIVSKEISNFLEISKDKSYLLDVGGFVGFMAIAFCRYKENRKAFVYEPSAINTNKMSEMIDYDDYSYDISYSNSFIGSKIGKVNCVEEKNYNTFMIKFEENNNAQIQLGYPEKDSLYDITTIDEFYNNSEVLPDVIKIDVEGYDYNALIGAKNTLINHKPMLFLEIHKLHLRLYNNNVRDIYDFLNEVGYTLYNIRKEKIDKISSITKLFTDGTEARCICLPNNQTL